MPLTRARRGAVKPARPKRRAAANRSIAQPDKGTVWTARTGNDLVGEVVKVYWSPHDIYYHAIVLEFDIKENSHKIIYLNDESIEIVELGTGPEQRTYILASEQTEDPLVGRELILEKEDHEEIGWFEFMRGGEEGADDMDEIGGSLLVRVLSTTTEEPDEDELAHERLEDEDAEHVYCRVIYVPNEFLATIDLAKVKHTFVDEMDDPNAEATVLPRSSQRLGTSASAPEKDTGIEEENDDDDAYEPNPDQDEDASPRDEDPTSSAQDDDIFPSDLAQAVKKLSSARKGKRKGARTRLAARMSIDNPRSVFEDDDDDPDTKVKVEKDIAGRALGQTEEDFAEPSDKADDRNSVASNDTQDQPVAANGKLAKSRSQRRKYPTVFSDEESDGQGRSKDEGGSPSGAGATFDDEIPSARKSGAKPPSSTRKVQVGDYIALETENGDRRKAFVEAYMPGLGMHFIAFCDTQGGNEQVKLTPENHIVLEDEEVDELNQEEKGSSKVKSREKTGLRKGRSSRRSPAVTPMAIVTRPTQAKTVKRRRVSTAERSKGKKKREASRGRPTVGDTAGSEICGRCLKIVWPGSNMIYTALVLGYNPEKAQHQVVYLSDHCVEIMELRFRKWNLLSKEDEPWLYHGWLGKRLYVWWLGEYANPEDDKKAKEEFDGEVRVPFEAYVLSYEGNGEYMIIYTTTADKEKKVLKNDDRDKPGDANQAWGVLGPDQTHVQGLPVVGWEPWKDADWDSKKATEEETGEDNEETKNAVEEENQEEETVKAGDE